MPANTAKQGEFFLLVSTISAAVHLTVLTLTAEYDGTPARCEYHIAFCATSRPAATSSYNPPRPTSRPTPTGRWWQRWKRQTSTPRRITSMCRPSANGATSSPHTRTLSPYRPALTSKPATSTHKRRQKCSASRRTWHAATSSRITSTRKNW